MRLFLGSVVLLAATLAHEAEAQERRSREEPPPANLGESCQARDDCKSPYRCLRNVCTTEEAVDATTPNSFDTSNAPLGYVGASIGTSLPVIWSNGLGESVNGAIRAGVVVVRQVQFQLEVSPAATAIFNATPPDAPIKVFDAVGTIAALIRMDPMVSWVVRAGGGGGGAFGGPVAGVSGFGEIRADVAGLEVRTSKHLLVEFNLASLHFFITPAYSNPFSVMIVENLAMSYAF